MNGEVLPTEARKVRPFSIRDEICVISLRSTRVSISSRSTEAASDSSRRIVAAAIAFSVIGNRTRSVSIRRMVASASSSERALQKRSSAARALRRCRHAVQALERMKYQLTTDIASSR